MKNNIDRSFSNSYLDKYDLLRLKNDLSLEPKDPEEEDENWDELLGNGEVDREQGARNEKETNSRKSKNQNSKDRTPVLDQYGINLNQYAREGRLDPVYGRNREMIRIAQILTRKKKNNPILLGLPGVGKTAVVEALAQRIESGDVPPTLLGKTIYSLDLASMVAGSMYRGQFEERIKKMLAEVQKNKNIILYIDEIHTLVGTGNVQGGLDAANILKPALARGEIRCIGATTHDEYKKTIEKDGALERRFQKVNIEPLTETETLNVLKDLRYTYEKFHHVKFSDEVLEACVNLTARYVTDRNFPDKAIDAMDEVGAYTFIKAQGQPTQLTCLKNDLSSIRKRKEEAVKANDYEKAATLRDHESELKLQMKQYVENLKNGDTDELPTIVVVEDVERVVSLISGVPLASVTKDELSKLTSLVPSLQKKVIGQDHAIEVLVKVIQRNKIGLRDPNKPIGSFLLLGSSGVGKTYLSKQLAIELFGSEKALIRVDMSEFMEKHTVSRLVGAPPGYVGYNEGGQLTDQVKRRPYSVVLFDEIEKAHPDVFNILLQVLDDGILTDGNGSTVNFKNTVILMTSNVGSRQLKDFGLGVGFKNGKVLDINKMSEDVIKKALKKTFAPEFLNRIDDIITFNSLSQKDILKIVDIELSDLNRRISNLKIHLKVSDEVRVFLAQKGYDISYGARPLKRAIHKYVENVLSDAMISGDIQPNNNYKIIMIPNNKSESESTKIVKEEESFTEKEVSTQSI